MSQPIVSKSCNACGIEKPLEEFNKNPRNRTTGRQAKCKPCEREYSRQWHASNRDHAAKRWAESSSRNPHWGWESRYRRRMLAAGHAPVVVSFNLGDLVSRHGSNCFYCGGPFEEIDHVVPIKSAGDHTIENVRPSCMPCNRSKCDKSLGDLQ